MSPWRNRDLALVLVGGTVNNVGDWMLTVQVSRLLKAALARLREHCDVDDLVGEAAPAPAESCPAACEQSRKGESGFSNGRFEATAWVTPLCWTATDPHPEPMRSRYGAAVGGYCVDMNATLSNTATDATIVTDLDPGATDPGPEVPPPVREPRPGEPPTPIIPEPVVPQPILPDPLVPQPDPPQPEHAPQPEPAS